MELDVTMKMEADRERESNDLTAMAMSKSGIEDESKPEERVIAEREKVDCDEDSVSKGNFNNEAGATSPDSIQTSRTDSLLIQTENLAETLSARLYSAEGRLGLEMTSEDGPKSINAVLPFGKALSKSKVPENAAMMKATADYSVQLQSPDCESPEIDPFCRASTEDVNDSWNTTDRDLNTQQGIHVGMDDSTSDCYHRHHSDNHVSVVTDNITQDMNLDYLLQNNKELKDNSTADHVKPSISRIHSIETVQNPPKDSVIANELSKASVSDDKPSQKPSKFRKLWAQRNSDPQKSFVTTSNPPLLPSVLSSPPAVEATERLQKVVPSAVGSEPEPGKNWGARVAKRKVLQEVKTPEENPVDIAGYKSSDSGLFRPQVSETPRSVGITSQAIFKTESVENFRTESKQSQHKLPHEMPVSTPAHEVMIVTSEPEENLPAPMTEVSSSSEEITDAYICYMIEKINKLKLKDFALPGKGYTNFCDLWENDWKQKNDIPLVKATVRQHFETLTTFLNKTVAASEDIFIEHICFPVPVKMDRELGRIFDVPPALITELPDDFITVLHSAISAFREEYRQRNRQILAHETQIREILMDHSVDYFREELYFQVIEEQSKKYVDLEDFRQIEDELRKSVSRNFFSVCSPDFWRAKLEQPLKDRLGATVRSIMDMNQNNKAQMDGLLALANEAIDVYENSMREFEMGQSFECRKEMFKGHDQAARSQALQAFEAGSSQVSGFQELNQFCLKEVTKRLDKSTNIRWGSIVQEETRIGAEQARKARELTRIAQEEDNRRMKKEADRMERESRRQLAPTKITNPQHSHSESFDASNDIGNKQQWRLTEEDGGKKLCDPQAQCAGASSAATNDSVGFNWIPSYEMHGQTSLPSAELAIHMGLHHTYVAFITPATGKFNLVADVKNRLYWNEYEDDLTPAFVEALASGPPVINFEGHIAWSTDMAYNFSLRQRNISMDLDDVLSQFLICLKRQAEVDSRREFNSCVVAVPQFLNTSQRLRIQQSANIAGFDNITFVNDTTAIAAVHMVNEEAVKGNAVVVNTQEGAVDVASFVFDHGKLECHGVTGDFFFEDHTDLLDEIVDKVKGWFVGHPKNFAKKFFTPTELRISPSSPNTKFLLLGKGENHEACHSAIRKATNYAKDEIHDILPETVVYGTAFICCLRSRDPYNSVLLKWQDKLHPSTKAIDNEVLDEVERKILRPERKLKKNMNVTTGYLLTSREAHHRRTKLNTSNKAVLHQERLGILKLIDSVEKSLGLLDELVSKSVRQDLDRYYKSLFQQDVNPQMLKRIKEEIITFRKSVFEMQGSFL